MFYNPHKLSELKYFDTKILRRIKSALNVLSINRISADLFRLHEDLKKPNRRNDD